MNLKGITYFKTFVYQILVLYLKTFTQTHRHERTDVRTHTCICSLGASPCAVCSVEIAPHSTVASLSLTSPSTWLLQTIVLFKQLFVKLARRRH